MTTLGGFDPSRSLLPAGGGTIHVMSGGGGGGSMIGGNMQTSLIPDATARIHVMTGGSPSPQPNVPVAQPNGAVAQSNGAVAQSNGAVAQNAVAAVAQPNVPVAQNAVAAVAQPNVPVAQPNVPVAQPNVPVAQSNVPVAQPNAAVAQPNGAVAQPNGAVAQPNGAVASKPNTTIQDEKKEELNKSTTTNNKPKRKSETPLAEDEKRVTLFGERLVLKKPRNNSTTFTEDQKRIFKLFGLQSASADMKQSVLHALYDGSCDTNRSLITMRACEPFRQIVRSLALRYLNKINGEYVEEEESEEDTPTQKTLNESHAQGKTKEETIEKIIEPMPTLSSGKPYQDELRSKMPAELIEVMNEIETLPKDFFKDYDIKIEEIDAKIKAFTPLVDDLATQIQSYLDQYKNKKSSDEQKAAFEAIEKKVTQLNQESEDIQQLLFEQPKSQEEIVSISTYIESKRAEVLQKKYELERSSIGLTTTFRMEDDKNIQDGQKWINLYPILHIRFEDRKEVMAPIKKSNQQLDTLLNEISEKKNIIRANTVFFVEEVQKKLNDLVESISGNAGNYRAEFIGNIEVDKTGQAWYDEMVATEEYKAIQRTIDENREKIQGDLSSFSSTVSSVEDEKEQEDNSPGSSSSTPGFDIPEEEQPPIELLDIQEAPTVAEEAPVVNQEAPVVVQEAPVVNQEAPVVNQEAPVVDQEAPVVNQEAPVVDQEAPVVDQEAPVVSREQPKNNSYNNVALGNTFISNQQGGATSEELVPYLERYLSVHEKMKNQLDSILDTKRRYIEDYISKHLQIPLEELVTKSLREKDANDRSDTLKPIARLQRNMIRLGVLHIFQTAQQSFLEKVVADNQTEHSTLQSMADTASHSYREHLEQSKPDLTNAYYLYLLYRSEMEPVDSLKDIHRDVTQAYHVDQAKMKEWTKQVFQITDLDASIKEIEGLINTYNAAVQSQSQYDQLPAQRDVINQKITDFIRTLEEKRKTIPSKQTILPSLSQEIKQLIEIYETNQLTFLTLYDTFHSRRPFIYLDQKDIQLVSDTEQSATKAILEEISKKLQEWYAFFLDYDIEYKKYHGEIENAKRQFDVMTVSFGDVIKTIPLDSIKNTALPADYAEKYKDKLLNKDLLSDDSKEIDSQEAIQGIEQEIEDDKKQLDTDEKAFIYDPDQSESYLQKATEVIQKYKMKQDLITNHIQALDQRKNELETKKKALEEYEQTTLQTIAQDAATNQSRSSLGSTNSTALLQVIEEFRVRREVLEQIEKKKTELDDVLKKMNEQRIHDTRSLSMIDQLQTDIETKKNEIIKVAYARHVLEEQQDFLGAAAAFSNEQKVEQNADRQRQLEELQSQIDAARAEVKLQKKIQRIEAVIQELKQKKEAVPNENQSEIAVALNKKDKKLRSLQELMAEQVRLRGSLPSNNKRIANTKTYPEKKEEDEEVNDTEVIPAVIRTSERIQGYMKDAYGVELTNEQLKALTRTLKEMRGSHTIQEIVEGDDLFNLLYKAAVTTGIAISPDKNPYLSYIDHIHKRYQEEKDIDLYRRIISDKETVGDLQHIDKEGNDYIENIHKVMDGMDTTIRLAIDEDPDRNHFLEQMNEQINQMIRTIQVDQSHIFITLAKRYKSNKLTKEEYVTYRRYLELLYALTESPMKEDLIQSYTGMYDRAKEAKEEAERNRLAKQAEQAKKEQEEKDRLEQHKANHYKGIKSTVKTLLRDMRSHISDIQKIKNPPKELTDLSDELKGIDDIIQTYTREYKNAIDKSARVFTSRISREIESALKKLDPYLQSNVLRKSEYSSIYKTISTLSKSSQEIVEYIHGATNANRENNKKNKTTFNNKYRQEEERMEQEKKDAEEKKQREEREAEEARIAAEKAAVNKAAAEQAERERIAAEKAAANKAAAEKAERNRVAAIRAQKEKEHKTQLDQLSRQIEAKKKKKEEFEDKLKEYKAVKKASAFLIHYSRLFDKGKIDKRKEDYVKRIFKKDPRSIGPSDKLPELKEPQLTSLIDLLQDAINPNIAQLENEIKGLEQQRENLLSGENGGDEKVSEKVMSETNMFQAKKNTEDKINEIKQIKEDMRILDFIMKHLPENGSVKGDQLNSLIDMMRKYKFLNSSSQRMFEQNARESYEKAIQTIASFRDQLKKVISNNELQIDDLQTKINKAEKKLRETPTYQLKNREALEKIESKLTRDTISNSINKSISIIKHYPDVSEDYIRRLTTIKDDSTIASDVKVQSLSTILQQFIQHLVDEHENHPPQQIPIKNLKSAEYFGRYPGRSNQKPVTQSKPKPNGSRGGSRKKRKTRKVKK